MIAHHGYLPTPRSYPVYLTDAHGPHAFTVTVIGDPDAAPGAVQVHVVYPASAFTVSEQDYALLVRLFAAHLLAHAAQYDAALGGSSAGEQRPLAKTPRPTAATRSLRLANLPASPQT